MKNIAIVMGGYSGEYSVSIASGNQVYANIDHSKYNLYRVVIHPDGWFWLDSNDTQRPVNRADFSLEDGGVHITFDLAFIIVHGNPGENGVLQGYFDLLHIPYTTCGFYTSSLTFHKAFCNAFVKSLGIVEVAHSILLYNPPTKAQLLEIIPQLHFPVFVKPATGGSSVATTKVKTVDALLPAIDEAFSEAREVLIEEAIPGREFDCGVFRTKTDRLIFPITEIIPTNGHEFFDYQAKYEGCSNEVTPAECPSSISNHIQSVAGQLYDALGCQGIVRFDFIYNTDTDTLFFLEANTIPGQSAESIVPKQARAFGISTPQLYQLVLDTFLPTNE